MDLEDLFLIIEILHFKLENIRTARDPKQLKCVMASTDLKAYFSIPVSESNRDI